MNHIKETSEKKRNDCEKNYGQEGPFGKESNKKFDTMFGNKN
jgi:hypothetical protein